MSRTKTWTLIMTLPVGFLGCGFFPSTFEDSNSALLTGQAHLGAPLDNATIVVETAAGDALQASSDESTSQGRFAKRLSLSLPLSDVASYLPLIVKVSGGTADGIPFDGTLMGYVSSFETGDHLHVDILSTLIVKYKRAAGVTFPQAERAVAAALRIPAGVDLTGKLNDPNFWFHFDPTRFMAWAQANGGFDAFTDQIVSNMIQRQTAGVRFVAGEEGGSIASAAGRWLLEETGGGLMHWGIDKGMDWLLSEFGYKDPTEKALDEIKDQLDQVNETLTAIQSEIGVLTGQMSELLALVQLSWDSLTSTISSLNMSTQEAVIQNQYNNMTSTFNSTNANLCTDAGNAAAAQFAADILSAQGYDIDQQVYDMYANITGKFPGSNGAIYDLTSKLIDQVKGGQDLYDAYIALENYFGQLAGIQAQGLQLMIEAINQPLSPTDGSGVTSFQGTATQYYDKFNSQMSEEVEVFLANVDRLVIAAVNVRSEIAKPTAYLSPETAAVYKRADFVANQLSAQQPAGLNVRLIGDPTVVSNWIMNQQIKVGGANPTVVTVGGNSTNKYAAVIPASTPGVNYYLEWTADAQKASYTFHKQTQISVVKLNYPASAAGSFTVSTPLETQTLNVALYNPDFQPATDTDTDITAYGSGVFHVRVLPTWQTGTAQKSNDSKKQWTSSWTPNPQDVTFNMFSQQTNPTTAFGSCPMTYAANIKTTIQDGETSDVNVALHWTAQEQTTFSWTAGNGNPSQSSKQWLACQSTTQTAANNTATVMSNITLKPNTATDISYSAEQNVTGSSIYNNYVRQTYTASTVAGMNSLEIVPQQ